MTYKQLQHELKRDKEKVNKDKREGKQERLLGYRRLWLDKGPIWFAENVLTCPTDVSSHPNYDPNNNPDIFCEGCGEEHPKFRDGGIPYHVVLSDYQKQFLDDLWKNQIPLSLVVASRGAGKTFVLALYCCWLLCTRDKFSITFMGGSIKQSKICQGYIDDWRYDIPIIYSIINNSLKGVERYATTIWRSRIDFSACSLTAARGPHVNLVILDEAATAEDKSEEGSDAIKAAMWQVTGKRVSSLIMSSTCHYIGGVFYEYMSNPDKYGFRLYHWAVAKHYTGKDAKEVYTDKDPSHWKSNVWWLSDKEIQKFRRTKSDEEFLSEGLGGASMASGAVFKKEDLDVTICSMCPECEPYDWNKCVLVKLLKLGVEGDPTKYILERRMGFDYGVSEAPCAITVVGRKDDVVFVLFNEEQIGLREEEKITWIKDNAKHWDSWDFIPDPAVGGAHLNEELEDDGYSVWTIAESDKLTRVYNLLNFVEKHKLVVPKTFWYLTQSLRKCAWDSKDHKIRKIDDHSFDSLCYSLDGFVVEESDNVIEAFLKMERKPTVDVIWGVKG